MRVFTIVALLCGVLLVGAGPAGAVTFTFNDLGSHQIYLSPENTFFVSETLLPFEITNNSGSEWIDFHLALEGVGATGAADSYPYMRFVDLGSDGIIYCGPGSATFSNLNGDALGYNEVMTVDGLSISSGAILSFGVDIFGGVAPQGLYRYSIYAMPSVGEEPPSSPVPEPATMLLLASGLAGLAGLRRKFKK